MDSLPLSHLGSPVIEGGGVFSARTLTGCYHLAISYQLFLFFITSAPFSHGQEQQKHFQHGILKSMREETDNKRNSGI